MGNTLDGLRRIDCFYGDQMAETEEVKEDYMTVEQPAEQPSEDEDIVGVDVVKQIEIPQDETTPTIIDSTVNKDEVINDDKRATDDDAGRTVDTFPEQQISSTAPTEEDPAPDAVSQANDQQPVPQSSSQVDDHPAVIEAPTDVSTQIPFQAPLEPKALDIPVDTPPPPGPPQSPEPESTPRIPFIPPIITTTMPPLSLPVEPLTAPIHSTESSKLSPTPLTTSSDLSITTAPDTVQPPFDISRLSIDTGRGSVDDKPKLEKSKSRKVQNAKAALITILTDGIRLTMHTKKSSRQAKVNLIDGNTLMIKKKKFIAVTTYTIALSDIIAVESGKSTESFQRSGLKSANDSFCFSIVTNQNICYDFQASSKVERDALANGLREMCQI